MCEFPGSNGNGLGDIWWTDKLFYFSSIDLQLMVHGLRYVVGLPAVVPDRFSACGS